MRVVLQGRGLKDKDMEEKGRAGALHGDNLLPVYSQATFEPSCRLRRNSIAPKHSSPAKSKYIAAEPPSGTNIMNS